ncbi:helix-turn-helix transcriptional regulator [Pseudonocardia acidicola]|uniref:helix-turn-helix transcriptional regulator n=1 Tax=Pseudonocardia acidicola TaxID=2724939 RepID=UPI0030841509
MDVSLALLHRAVSLVDDLAGLTGAAEFATVALAGLGELIGCDVATYSEIGQQVHYTDHPRGALDHAPLGAFAAHVHEHPLINHYRHTGDSEALRISDLVSRHQFRRLGLYAEFYRHVPTGHQLAVTLAEPGARVVGIALSRAHREFSDTDRAVLSALRDPLLSALRRAEQRARRSPLSGRPGLATLTERELQVLDLAAAGHTNDAIARGLGLSPRTVAKHLEHVYRKLGVGNRAAASWLAAGQNQPSRMSSVVRSTLSSSAN